MSDLNLDGLTDAQLRLFAVRCVRRVQHLMTDPQSITTLDVAERHAKGEATDEELRVARAAAFVVADAAAAAAVAAAAARDAADASWDVVADVARAAAEWAAASADAERARSNGDFEADSTGATAMNEEDIIRMARDAGLVGLKQGGVLENFQRFAALVATAEKQKVVEYMNSRAFATGHGDTVEDLLEELEWQVVEREREACAKVAESYEPTCDTCPSGVSNAIRARGEA